ncbi:HAMP domain-containing sensor histidine kinase [Fibrobacter sp. UBA4297]|uniref:sensor histidine kinase n=1 Tax=Fibrobacter sp. UBA4297 TaxID=1946536 RepID=UPI0025C29ACC|nr:HAMP domain-containing sensor histidine kinase [Fibrobacter sp. UBA4297]
MRNIQNEAFLAQKNYNESVATFREQCESTISKEQSKIFQEVKSASLYLYEQPHSLLDFGNATQFKTVNGIEAMFLYNNGTLIYPDISSKHFSKTSDYSNSIASQFERMLFREDVTSAMPQPVSLSKSARQLRFSFESIDDQIQNILGLIRIAYKTKDYDEALRLLNILEEHPHQQGYLHSDLTRSVNLLHFEILVAQKKHKEAEDYTIAVLNQFLQSENIENLPSAKFFFETAFTQILSFENLSQEKREAFWNLRENFNRQLGYMDIFFNNKDIVQSLLNRETTSKSGIDIMSDNKSTFIKMSYPILSGDQVVLAKVNIDEYRERMRSKLKTSAQGWKGIPYSITEGSDKALILGHVSDSSAVLAQVTLDKVIAWNLTLYEKGLSEIKNETRKRMFLMYGLLSFSLITVLLGSVVMFRFLTQEHKLLAMKANFLSSVSHELKTPLTSIKMFAEMMARGRVQKVEKVQEYSGLIGKEATRLENLIGAILNYTRMEHGKGGFHWEKLDFSACVQKVFDNVEDIGVEKGLMFHTKIEPNLFVIGDYTALYSLVQNLIENAIKYTNAPGDITITVSPDEDRIVFSVADTGIGIPSSEQKNIFNDFYRVGDEMTRSTKGSGLGLAIVKRVAETHKATISLTSKPGKGSTFTVRFKKAE